MFGKNVDAYKKFAFDLQNGRFPNLSCIPNGLSDYVRLMLNSIPEQRPSVYDISKVTHLYLFYFTSFIKIIIPFCADKLF